jgi:hypothetical protein
MPESKHGPSVKNPKQYEGLRENGMSKQRAAAISNANESKGSASSRKAGRKKVGRLRIGRVTVEWFPGKNGRRVRLEDLISDVLAKLPVKP